MSHIFRKTKIFRGRRRRVQWIGSNFIRPTVFGLLISTTNSGTAQLRFRSETTAVITARSGFTLVVEKI